MKLSKTDFLKRYAYMEDREVQSVLDRHPEADNIDDALDIEYQWYLNGLD